MTNAAVSQVGAMAALAAIMFSAGCGAGVVSQETYFNRQHEVDEHNQAQRAKALEALRAKGYRVLPESRFYVELAPEERARCMRAGRGGDQPLTPEDTMVVRWSDPMSNPASAVSRANQIAEEVVVQALAACAFFSGGDALLARVQPAGSRASVVRLPEDGAAVLDPKGQLSLVVFRPKVSETENIKVEMSCNLMPSPRPRMIEENGPVYVTPAMAVPPRVEFEIDETWLRMSCTDQSE